jgi:type IV pilus assembly protein PilA
MFTPSFLRGARRGFTLIELLLVIGIIAILAAIVIVAINPTKQLGDARDAQRRSDVNTILNAVYQYSIDHTGNLPTTITTVDSEICKLKDDGVDPAECRSPAVHLSMLTGTYLVSIPADPQVTTGTGTRYRIYKTNGNRVTVYAPDAEEAATITVTR